jgi:hypothetical protein
VEIFLHLRAAYGRSALLLSGGAGLGIHHFGVVKALHEQGLLPRIISGTVIGFEHGFAQLSRGIGIHAFAPFEALTCM